MNSQFIGSCQDNYSLPMDLVSGWLGVWSLSRLSSKYTGVACNVRRSSDNATTDVFYDQSGKISGSSIISAGGSLSTWTSTSTLFITSMTDLSGNGRNFTTAVTANQPTLVLNSLNSQAVARFSGAQQLILTSALNVQWNTLFCLQNIPSSANRGVIFGNFTSIAANNASNYEKEATNVSRIFLVSSDLLVGSNTSLFGAPNVFSFIRNTATPQSVCFVGNVQDTTTTFVATNVTNTTPHGMGADMRTASPSTSVPLTGDITTLMVYQAPLTFEQTSQVSRSLGHIGGLNI